MRLAARTGSTDLSRTKPGGERALKTVRALVQLGPELDGRESVFRPGHRRDDPREKLLDFRVDREGRHRTLARGRRLIEPTAVLPREAPHP